MRRYQENILARIGDMPEEWDGIEIRQYVADKLRAEAFLSPEALRARPFWKTRAKDYRNEVIVRNL
jgi:hypothetical protein